MSDYATINLQTVSLSFGQIQAIDNLDLVAPPGEITVLLGPNGAGKTTAIRLITGALTPTSGTVNVLGRDPSGPGGELIRALCGVVSAKPSLYDRLSGYDNLLYAAELYGLAKTTSVEQKIRTCAARFGISEALDQRVGGYSTGMKTRLALARSILHDPQLLLLDEPTSGLDPESAQAVLELIRTMTQSGQTVLMCTHLLSEAEGLADEIIMIEAGTSLISGKPQQIADRYWPDTEVTFTATVGDRLDVLANTVGVKEYARSDDTAVVKVTDAAVIPDLVTLVVGAGAALTSVRPFEPSLEDLYFAIRREAGQSTKVSALPPVSTGQSVGVSS